MKHKCVISYLLLTQNYHKSSNNPCILILFKCHERVYFKKKDIWMPASSWR